MATRSTITVRTKADYPIRYTCLFCGVENRDTIHFEAARSEDVASASKKQHAGDLAQTQAGLYNGLMESFDRSIRSAEADFERFAAFWKGCASGVRPASKCVVPMPTGYACKCRACGQLQPYDNNRYRGKGSALFMISLIVAMLGILSGAILLLVSLTPQQDAALLRTIGLCMGGIGIVALPVCVTSGKRSARQEASEQFEEPQAALRAGEASPV